MIARLCQCGAEVLRCPKPGAGLRMPGEEPKEDVYLHKRAHESECSNWRRTRQAMDKALEQRPRAQPEGNQDVRVEALGAVVAFQRP